MFASPVLKRDAFSTRIAQIRPALMTRAVASVGVDCAEDRVQNACLRAWELVADFDAADGNDKLYLWVAAILDFNVREYVRAERRHPETLLSPAAVLSMADGTSQTDLDSEQWLKQREELYRRLQTVVLTPEDRSIVGAWLAGCSQAEIGAELEDPMSRHQVGRVLARVGRMLRDLDSAETGFDVAECIQNLPAALFYIAPCGSWKHKPHRPDRQARARAVSE